MAAAPPPVPICPYCGREANLMRNSAALYHGHDYGPMWVCLRPTCEAWVGTHKGTERPLGRLANAELRKAKRDAHAAFDRLWQGKMKRDGVTKQEAMAAAYRWLAGQLEIDRKETHIGMMNPDQCRRVVEICAPFLAENRRAA